MDQQARSPFAETTAARISATERAVSRLLVECEAQGALATAKQQLQAARRARSRRRFQFWSEVRNQLLDRTQPVLTIEIPEAEREAANCGSVSDRLLGGSPAG